MSAHEQLRPGALLKLERARSKIASAGEVSARLRLAGGRQKFSRRPGRSARVRQRITEGNLQFNNVCAGRR